MREAHDYIEKIGFSGKLKKTKFGKLFSYEKELFNLEIRKQVIIHFIFYKNEKSLFNYHLTEWNKNKLDYFIAVGLEKSHIVNAKEKPEENNPFKKEVLVGEDGFSYGVNTAGYEDIVPSEIPFTKDKIDNAVFFDFVLQKTKEIKNEVDTHLLNNLISLKNELSKFDENNENINALILKSLFIKYLEDRNILIDTSLTDTLKTGNPKMLEQTFKDISIINGDILKKNLVITHKHINELEIFFTHDYQTYKNNQPNLFYPYRFDKIPIQLISNIYEEFLGRTNLQEKKSKGIFYTRTFVVDFMLSHTIYPKIKEHPQSTILDPACGSGAFLVQTFKHILRVHKTKKISIDDKANILKKQIFGLDTDASALQITAFSLYLTLLDGISKEEIQEQIKVRNPILPSLIGSNLLQKNTITDEIEFNIEIIENNKTKQYSFKNFDCIVANPPWRKTNEEKIKKTYNEKNIFQSIDSSYLQLSQFFLLKILELSHKNTQIAIIVNSSNFFSGFSKKFREEVLSKYRLKKYFELSKLKNILFNKAGEPASVLILDTKPNSKNVIDFIVPDLTSFSKKLRIITYSNSNLKKIKQSELKKEDILWRIFVNGDWKEYQLIKKIIINNSKTKDILCQRGFEPFAEQKMEQIGKEIELSFYNTSDKTNYFINEELGKFLWNRKLRRLPIPKFFSEDYFKLSVLNKLDNKEKELIKNNYKKKEKYYYPKIIRNKAVKLELENILSNINQSIFTGKRLIIERSPSKQNKIRTIYTEKHIVCKDNTFILKIEKLKNYKLLLAVLNSSLTGFFFSHLSPQFSKGARDALRVTDFENFPYPQNPNKDIENIITDRINTIEKYKKTNKPTTEIEKELDELVFNLYGLLEFEKEIIREFYQINVERKNDYVKGTDIETYARKFRDTYQVMIKQNLKLNISFIKSSNIGSIIKFEIVDKEYYNSEIEKGNFTQRGILQLVRDKKIQNEKFNGYINEEKVKIYDGKSFYIIKSNQFKDWTKRQAMEDANEELHEIIKKMQS